MGQVLIPTAETFPDTADAVVVGGGIVGVATAFWLSRAGLDTVLVEMRDDLSTLTTPQSIECFRAQFTEPAMAELVLQSIDVFEHLDQVIGIPGYDIALRHQGYLFVTDDAGMVDRVKAAVETHHRLGVTDSEFLSGDEARARCPGGDPERQGQPILVSRAGLLFGGRLFHRSGRATDQLVGYAFAGNIEQSVLRDQADVPQWC